MDSKACACHGNKGIKMLSVSLKGKERRGKPFLSAAQNAYGTVCRVGERHIPPPCNPSALSILTYSQRGTALATSALLQRCICTANSETGVLKGMGMTGKRKERGVTAWKKLLWLAFSTMIGRQLQAGASGVATVRLFQKEKLLDYKSLPKRSLHMGFQRHPPSTALTPGRSCSAGSACLPTAAGGGRKSNSTPRSSLPSEPQTPRQNESPTDLHQEQNKH